MHRWPALADFGREPVPSRDRNDRRLRPLCTAFARSRYVYDRRFQTRLRPSSTTAGVSVLADQVQNLRFALVASLKTIAAVRTRSSMDVVRAGTTTDVYSVNAAVTQAVQGVGGGGNLNNAYSAIATVPGTFVPPNQQGWNQAVYIRGGSYDQVGYEFDGVPVNRSLDNYPGGTAGTLGQQELQVYAAWRHRGRECQRFSRLYKSGN